MINTADLHFYCFMAASLVLFIAIIKAIARSARWPAIVAAAVAIVCGGMFYARFAAQAGLPWWGYYVPPMLVTVFGPPLFFRMRGRQVVAYLIAALLSAPTVHVTFSLLLGWHEYMPFWHVPQLFAGR
jgi:predicted membrane channel-forming protein YqfA (hemolysin III family)